MAEEEKKTYITDELKAQLGVEMNRRVSPPVALSDIRKWAIAIYWPETPPRLFWDEEYAKTTEYGGIITPEDFNPFAWPIERPAATGAAMVPGTRVTINLGGEATYHLPIRPGEVITSVSKLVDLYERETRLGLMVFMVRETRWTNQKGELIKVYRGTGGAY